jgi:hypothetical protein
VRAVGGCAVGGCMLDGKNGAHTMEWINKTQEFIDRVFSGPLDEGVKWPCSSCKTHFVRTRGR